MKQIAHKNLTWIDIEQPTEKDVEFLKKNFHFHPVVLAEVIPPSRRSKVEHYDHFLFMVLHIPVFNPVKRTTVPAELDIFVTKTHLITVHYGYLPPLDGFLKKCGANAALKEKYFSEGAGALLYHLVEQIFNFYHPQLSYINKNIDVIEEQIFKGREKAMIHQISLAKREILDFRRIIRPQHSILESLLRKGPKFFGAEMAIYFSDLIGDFDRIFNTLDHYKETIESLEHTNESLVSNKLNEMMRLLTIFSTILLPLSFITQIFNMTMTATVDFLNTPMMFWLINIFILFVGIFMYAFFKLKKWL
ncbi:TPA: hypothetical protein DCP13_03195 [Candidatus Azambacteria bacterium]|uniref:Mg2+ transporter protein, CorA family protein n=1 Tax=Candidatus Azambacteria bacterium GW2011_GWC1_46_13 TaxID=1618619 RepID=A0A0G1NQN0_9BACT|nr:MAG: Mg2+ transporter protein, CorA family protein [Candidatus Azambacteria bacterium GW2011_GWC1_46_13]HAM95778.1 hypothetical protein [Candidatus Azambacteria bacterium]HAQ05773.1 hypothetical protein [Candidatus Azambacteria bacterium]HCB36525.1 hypothetical protein [Candidatus Azambacteria bacterium]